jgi:Gpi18-like mannosyltransferase
MPRPKDIAAAAPVEVTRINPFHRLWPLILALVLTGISVAVRVATRAVVTTDLEVHILPWYTKLHERGILVGLGQDFYNYTPPYLYLLALATFTAPLVSAVAAIKLISTGFDFYAAFMIYKIVRLRFSRGHLPLLAAAIFFAAPTVVANTGVWGQADSTYTAFLLTCLYFLLVDGAFLAVVFFSIALAFKPQAIFFAPLLMIMLLRRKISWYDFLAVPVVYAVLMWPAVALGRTWTEVFTAYPEQAGSGKGLTHNAATLYVFVPKSAFDSLLGLGIVLAVAVLLIWVLWSWRRTRQADPPDILLLALISVTLTPFLLPNMHDRYFYPADAISIAAAFILPELWMMPVLFQLVSGLSYSLYLLSAPPDNLALAGLINITALILLFRRQASMQTSGASKPAARVSAP